jgi:hypothetical protein
MAEAIQLKVNDIFEGKGYDGVLIKDEAAAIIRRVGYVPGMNDEHARGATAQAKAHDFRIVKIWNLTEPRDEIGATRDAGVDCLGFVHDPQENDPAWLVKHVRF